MFRRSKVVKPAGLHHMGSQCMRKLASSPAIEPTRINNWIKTSNCAFLPPARPCGRYIYYDKLMRHRLKLKGPLEPTYTLGDNGQLPWEWARWCLKKFKKYVSTRQSNNPTSGRVPQRPESRDSKDICTLMSMALLAVANMEKDINEHIGKMNFI